MDLDSLKDWIVALTLVVFIGAIGALALNAFRDNIEVGETTSVVNETVTIASGAGIVSQSGELYVSLSAIRNETATTGATYTLSVDDYNVTTGHLTIAGNRTDTSVYADYVHYTPTAQRNITNHGITGTINASSYFGTMGTIMGVAILIMLVIGAFYVIRK